MKQTKTEASIELKEGIMTNREMAEWFGCSMTISLKAYAVIYSSRSDEYITLQLIKRVAFN